VTNVQYWRNGYVNNGSLHTNIIQLFKVIMTSIFIDGQHAHVILLNIEKIRFLSTPLKERDLEVVPTVFKALYFHLITEGTGPNYPDFLTISFLGCKIRGKNNSYLLELFLGNSIFEVL
jgi:hypothetical protein